MNIKDLQNYLDKLKEIPVRPKWERSLMDITGISHHENMWSDIYGFFFNTCEEHGFEDLFIRSLESKICLESFFLNSFFVKREFVVDDKKRIDLLLSDIWNKRAIIIENKVNHKLDNDLNLYYETVKESGYSDVLVLVLGIKKYNLKSYKLADRIPKNKLFSITHKELIDEVEHRMISYYKNAMPHYLYLFKEFAKNVINKTNDMDTKELNFYFSRGNRLKINKLSKIRSSVIEYLSKSIQDETIRDFFEKYDLELDIGKLKNNEYIYYPYKGYDNKIMITLIYSHLWDCESHESKIQVLLEIQGDMIEWVRDNYNKVPAMEELKCENDYWHYYSCDIHFNPLELEENFQDKLCEKLSNDSICPIYWIGKDIINQYESKK